MLVVSPTFQQTAALKGNSTEASQTAPAVEGLSSNALKGTAVVAVSTAEVGRSSEETQDQGS
jgi:hypothetical protein